MPHPADPTLRSTWPCSCFPTHLPAPCPPTCQPREGYYMRSVSRSAYVPSKPTAGSGHEAPASRASTRPREVRLAAPYGKKTATGHRPSRSRSGSSEPGPHNVSSPCEKKGAACSYPVAGHTDATTFHPPPPPFPFPFGDFVCDQRRRPCPRWIDATKSHQPGVSVVLRQPATRPRHPRPAVSLSSPLPLSVSFRHGGEGGQNGAGLVALFCVCVVFLRSQGFPFLESNECTTPRDTRKAGGPRQPASCTSATSRQPQWH